MLICILVQLVNLQHAGSVVGPPHLTVRVTALPWNNLITSFIQLIANIA